MKTVVCKVPRRLAWYVQQAMSPEDAQAFWRLSYYYDRLCDADRAFRTTRLLLFVVPPLLVLFGALTWALDAAIVLIVALYAVHAHRRACDARMQGIIGADEQKWRALGEPAVAIKQECAPNDPTETITITLPDE